MEQCVTAKSDYESQRMIAEKHEMRANQLEQNLFDVRRQNKRLGSVVERQNEQLQNRYTLGTIGTVAGVTFTVGIPVGILLAEAL